MEYVTPHYTEVLANLSESLREQRRAAFLINLVGNTEDDGYFVPAPRTEQSRIDQMQAEIV